VKTLLYSYYEPEGQDIQEIPFGKLHYLMPPYTKLRAIKFNCKGCDTKIIEVYACTEDEKE
jgi:hypothetical protein